MGEVEVKRVGTAGLGSSGLNWESGVGIRMKAGGRALQGVGALRKRRYGTVGEGMGRGSHLWDQRRVYCR